MISANGGLPAHRYTPQVTRRWPRGSEPASATSKTAMKPKKPNRNVAECIRLHARQRNHMEMGLKRQHSICRWQDYSSEEASRQEDAEDLHLQGDSV